MDKRKLGQTGYEIAPFAFGGNVFGWTVDEPTSFKFSKDRYRSCAHASTSASLPISRWPPVSSPGNIAPRRISEKAGAAPEWKNI
jgi:hypothetical protein